MKNPIQHLTRTENFYELIRQLEKWSRREKLKKIYGYKRNTENIQ